MSRFAAVDPDFIKELSNASTPANTTNTSKPTKLLVCEISFVNISCLTYFPASVC